MLLTFDVIKIDFLVVDVIELDVFGARHIKYIKISFLNIDVTLCFGYHLPPMTSQVRMRVESSLKGPIVPATIEPFSSRMMALLGGTEKQNKFST